jgi:hypothetical protein
LLYSCDLLSLANTFLEINEILDDIAAFSYPDWLTDAAPFLPPINLQCVATSGINFLSDAVANSTSASVTGLLNAITNGCSSDAFSLALSGGYNKRAKELTMNMVLEINARSNV